MLRNRQLGGFKFRRQYALGPYVLDFFCLREKLAIEADGGSHVGACDTAHRIPIESTERFIVSPTM